ncbi:MAG: hypothetical protein C4518_04880 [Desulfobacteraceae bacterium]|nr:MAG: hypothetical protein C4518_04880 [Desulfobacteraceae bacterium]
MIKNQNDIYAGKRKFLYYYTPQPSPQKILIPDTPNALKKAIDKGAKAFDTLSFCRYPDRIFPAPRRWGDLYITIQDSNIIENDHRFYSIKNVISDFLTYNLKIGRESGIFNVFSLDGVGLQINSWTLRLEGGEDKLSDIYCHIAALLKKEFDKRGLTGFKIENRDRIETSISKYHNYSNALNHNEFFSNGYEVLKALSKQPRVWNNVSQSGSTRQIPPQIFMMIINEIREQQIEKTLIQLFKHCRFLNHCINGIKDIPAEILPYIDGIQDVSPKVLNAIFEKTNQEFTRHLMPMRRITPTVPSTCDQLKSLEICYNEKCSRQSPEGIFDPNWKWPNPILLPKHSSGDRSALHKIKCAVMIFQILTKSGIGEFDARDALRLVRGTFPTMDEVRAGLELLTDHFFLVPCDFPPYSYAGRRSSEWYIVNPMANDQLFE